MNIHWGFLDVFFLVKSESAKDYAKTCPATPAYAPTSTDVLKMFNEWQTWTMADLDIFALGKTFQEIVSEKGWALTELFKEEFRMIQERLLHRDQDLQQAGLQLSGQSWNGWGTLPVPKETTQITSIPPTKPLPSCIDGMIQCTIVAV